MIFFFYRQYKEPIKLNALSKIEPQYNSILSFIGIVIILRHFTVLLGTIFQIFILQRIIGPPADTLKSQPFDEFWSNKKPNLSHLLKLNVDCLEIIGLAT